MKPKYRMMVAGVLTSMALLVGIAGSAVQIGTAPSKAEAATTGAGYSGITPEGGYLGNYIVPDGSRAYCIDSSADWPSGATGGGSIVSSLSMATGEPLSATVLQKLNYALSNWGQTADATQAAAVDAYVYAYTSTWAHYNGQGYATGVHYINGNSAVQNAFDNIWNATEANAGSVQNAVNPSGWMSLAVDNNNYNGTLTVTGMPGGARVNLTLTNGVFSDTGSATRNGVGNGTYGVRGTPPNNTSLYKISAVGNASFSNGYTFDPNVTIYYTGAQQRVIKGGTTTPHISYWTMSASDPFDRSTVFSPIATTQVTSRFVSSTAPFSDTLAAAVAAGSQPWRQFDDGSYFPIVAKGTLYYLGADQPTAGASVLAGATAVGTASVTLKGPGTYTAPSVLPADHNPGFYNWVWAISSADQSAFVQTTLPTNYAWSDQFGHAAETHVVASQLSGISQVNAAEVGFGQTVSDALTVTLDKGPWPTIGGNPVPAHFQQKAYWVAGDVAPTSGDVVPSGATLFHTTDVTVTAPGTYSSDSVSAPPTSPGYLVNVWAIVQDGPGANYFADWNDGWATKGEVTRVVAPSVTTQAVASVALGDEANDSAIVSGPIPAPYCGTGATETDCPNTVTFAAYQQKDLTAQPICDPSNEVFNTGYTADSEATASSGSTPAPTATPIQRDPAFFFNKPVPVNAAGSYPSAKVIFKTVGVYYWVATFRTGDGTVIHTGDCGEQSEKTVVAEDDIVTTATSLVSVGQSGHDTALVTGVIPTNATIEFAVYKQSSTTAICDSSNEVKVGTPHPLPETGQYLSDDYTFTQPGTYFWVETVRNARGEITHQGKCGADGETTNVAALAKTGSDTEAFTTIGFTFGGLLIVAGVLLFVIVRRSKRTQTK